MSPDLDRWLPAPALRTRHRRESTATQEDLWRAATAVRLRDCRLLGRLVAARIPGASLSSTFDAMFASPPFLALERGPNWALSGLCGRIWTVRGEFGSLERPQDFLDWCEPASARVLFAHWTEARAGGAALHSEVRVGAVDRRAAVYLRALDPFITAFQGLVGLETLAAAVRLAEEGR